MKKWIGFLAIGFVLMVSYQSAEAYQLQDLMSGDAVNPIDVWRKMRPQDFIGAPTIWQIIV